RAEWTVELGLGGPRALDVDLDDGLEIVDVTGPGIRSYASEVNDRNRRLTIHFGEGVAGPTPVAIQALARVPSEGPWAAPAARPSGAVWTGGRPLIQLGSPRVLDDCRERAGRQVEPTAEELDRMPRTGLLLAFEAVAPGPVAELVLSSPRAEATVEIR